MFRQSIWPKTLIFEQSSSGRIGHQTVQITPKEMESLQKGKKKISPNLLRSKAPALPEVSELEVIRHFTRLSQMNYGVDTGFYPLGSCTMKYNPKVCDLAASLPKAQNIHPYQLLLPGGFLYEQQSIYPFLLYSLLPGHMLPELWLRLVVLQFLLLHYLLNKCILLDWLKLQCQYRC